MRAGRCDGRKAGGSARPLRRRRRGRRDADGRKLVTPRLRIAEGDQVRALLENLLSVSTWGGTARLSAVAMVALEVFPDDPRLVYSGYVDVVINSEAASFSRQYGDGSLDGFGPAARQAGGARVTFLTTATQIAVYFR
eukprot:6129885-Pleurochrysis_carterae.AAC.1